MRMKELLLRLTGISTPVFGVSWNPPRAAVATARKVIAFLEDRRVLYTPAEMESPAHCVSSVLEIRRFLTEVLGDLDQKDAMVPQLRAMRGACRKFLGTVEADERSPIRFAFDTGHNASWVFLGALGEMRGVFGVHVAAIAAMYGLSIERGLSAILPGPDK